jgi:hypothetical protein
MVVTINRVDFDVTNEHHLKAVHKFIETGKWDIHFTIPKGCTNLPYLLLVESFKYLVNKCQITK